MPFRNDLVEKGGHSIFHAELIAHTLNAGVGKSASKLTVAGESGDRVCEGTRILLRDQHTGAPCQKFGHSTCVRSDDWYPSCHRFNEKYRNSFPLLDRLDARKQGHVPPKTLELHQQFL